MGWRKRRKRNGFSLRPNILVLNSSFLSRSCSSGISFFDVTFLNFSALNIYIN